ncbi:MAG: hypothetical protein ABEH90_05360 [Halolamina sp.]
MPASSGASHAGAALSSFVIAALLDSYLSVHATTVVEATSLLGSVLTETVGVRADPSLVGLVVATSGLAFIWGVVYHHGRHS